MTSGTPIGFDWNDGGINNQKLALLGLVITAKEFSTPFFLPRIYSKDQRDERSSVHNFAEIFDYSLFENLLTRWQIEQVAVPEREYADRIERCGWHYFNVGAWHLSQNPEFWSSGLVADFFRSLQPVVTRSSVFLDLCHTVFGTMNLSVVNQLRIEEDWRIHCQYSIDPTVKNPEDYNISASQIITKTRDTLGISAAFVSCDERYIHVSKQDLTQQVLNDTGVKIYWKSDFLDPTISGEMRPIDASLIDFELAKIAKTFVGMSRSTFANLAAFERYCARFQNQSNDFIYNLPCPRLGLRLDLGRRGEPFEVCDIKR